MAVPASLARCWAESSPLMQHGDGGMPQSFLYQPHQLTANIPPVSTSISPSAERQLS